MSSSMYCPLVQDFTTPLQLATEADSAEIVALLIENGTSTEHRQHEAAQLLVHGDAWDCFAGVGGSSDCFQMGMF